VDATNAFNRLNHQVALRNISILCPSFARILINAYREDSKRYINGNFVLSQEGTTQGDPLAMPMYALGVVPLIQKLAGIDVSQMWYADDASTGGSLQSLCAWWDHSAIGCLHTCVVPASELGASCWLTTLPIVEHGFALGEGEFHDALCLRFGWQPVNLPQTCVCGETFNVEHAFTCPYGGFPSICLDEVRDLTASLLSEVCSDVGVEPALQTVEGEPL